MAQIDKLDGLVLLEDTELLVHSLSLRLNLYVVNWHLEFPV